VAPVSPPSAAAAAPVQAPARRRVLRPGSLARNSLWMLSGQVTRALVQALYFICVARALGVEGYGAFLSVTALAAILLPYVGWGAGNLMVQHTARDASVFRAWWGYAIEITLATGALALLLATAVGALLLPRSVPLGLVLSVAAADLIFLRLLDVAAQAYQAFERLRRTAQLQVLPSAFRLAAAALMLLLAGRSSPLLWGVLYLASTAVCAVLVVALVSVELGTPVLRRSVRLQQSRTGFFFAVGQSAQGIYNDIDKTMLARLGELSAVGLYGAAYRMVDVAFVPVRAVLFAAYARFFEHGRTGIEATFAFARRLVPGAAAYSVAAGLALYLAAPLLPLVLGREFESTVQAVQWLSVIPFLRALHYFAADTLTGADRQGVRSAVQVSVALANVGLNLALIPRYSWRGAAVASLICESLLVAGMWTSVWMVRRSMRAA
jgi:O-antigen/teichoic acid export membrane protein